MNSFEFWLPLSHKASETTLELLFEWNCDNGNRESSESRAKLSLSYAEPRAKKTKLTDFQNYWLSLRSPTPAVFTRRRAPTPAVFMRNRASVSVGHNVSRRRHRGSHFRESVSRHRQRLSRYRRRGSRDSTERLLKKAGTFLKIAGSSLIFPPRNFCGAQRKKCGAGSVLWTA